MVGYDSFGEVKSMEMVLIFYKESIIIRTTEFKPLNRPLGMSPKASIEEASRLELKYLPSYLKYAFYGDIDTLLIILSTGLSNV